MALPAQTSLLRRIIVGVALLGVLVVTHLGLQQATGFANGCAGLPGFALSADAIGAESAGCAAAANSQWATMFGVSNIVWGLLFYGLVTLLRLGYAWTGDNRLRLVSAGVVGVGVLYSAFLVYIQAVEIGSFCVLCMTSAGLVLTLFVLHLLEQRRLQTGLVDAPRRPRQVNQRGAAALRPYVPILGLFVVLLGADLAFASRSATDVAPGEAPSLLQPASADRGSAATGACTYDPGMAPITDLSPFTTGPFKGNPDAPVTIVKVFDPNCPHCKDLSEVVDRVVAQNEDAAQFHYVAYPLRETSVGQAVALKLAAREGRFFELMNEMFRRQDNTWGMTVEELVESAEAVGMSGAAVRSALEDDDQLQTLLSQIQTEATAVQTSFVNAQGSISVPKLAINGRVIAPTLSSYSERCLNEFIAEAAAP
ncbi:MAG: vitamin K epoxide reductase family protein [Bacteroidota bacterium]